MVANHIYWNLGACVDEQGKYVLNNTLYMPTPTASSTSTTSRCQRAASTSPTCTGQNGTIPVKASQQHLANTTYVEKYGCVVIETQDWIDTINRPQWGRQQWRLFSPTTEPALNYQKYIFSVVN
ncbi:hypothetical protein LTR91_024499 [Friedmanniomyces endolithicus]|uniref:Uncharacterized protein n=1 Tax=Friedmanniomyces endolithicus TaxID=329885 RepID=A0AAN6H4L0_9PEZI|nr:hypothetical protein LTR94_017675 [Friedmanniomyces endolithicus]KAK0768491.1 hypothetical protein LTR59_017632 [Friedmanniomyces endolithicus]KAK0770475.1 hypothetical protein LTR38_017566 [Friedmanniomyces endolithicus]KAK0772163.1 hypothetical protein LTR75_017483 [Friedmanniomyces endolithicus]KAK0825314.1 hypothetical protein LTR03_017503 [Friedmanniomyces endolithicus]